MKKKSTITKFLFIILLSLFIFPKVSSASTFESELNQQTQAFAGEQGAGFSNPTDPRTVVANVITIFLSIIGILFLIYGVYAGSLIMMSGGEQDKINKGKSTLKTAVIGVFIVFSAYSIMRFIVAPVWNAGSGNFHDQGSDSSDYNP